MKSKLIWAGLFVLLLVSGVQADKTLTVKTLTEANFLRINVENVAGSLTMCGTYQLKDSTGSDVGHQSSFCKTLTAAQKTTLINFVVSDVGLAAGANTQEGM